MRIWARGKLQGDLLEMKNTNCLYTVKASSYMQLVYCGPINGFVVGWLVGFGLVLNYWDSRENCVYVQIWEMSACISSKLYHSVLGRSLERPWVLTAALRSLGSLLIRHRWGNWLFLCLEWIPGVNQLKICNLRLCVFTSLRLLRRGGRVDGWQKRRSAGYEIGRDCNGNLKLGNMLFTTTWGMEQPSCL